MASGDLEGQIILWSAKTGKKLANLVGHSDQINDLVYNPDGGLLASASRDPTVRVWDTSTGTELAILPADKSDIWSEAPQVAFSPDGTRLISVGKSVLWWETGTWVQLNEFQGTADAISPDGMQLAIGGMDGSMRLVDAVSGDEQLVMSVSIIEPLFIIKYSPEGTHLVGFGWNNGVVWNTETGQAIFNITEEIGLKGIFSPDGSRLIIIGQGGTARIWDVTTGKELFTLTGTGGLINLAVSPDCDNLFNWCGARLATAGRDEITVWDISPAGKSELLNIPGIGGEFSPDGKSIVTFLPLYLDPDFKLSIRGWNITPEMLGTLEFSHTLSLTSWPEAVYINKDVTKAAWLTSDNYLTIFDLVNGIQIITFPLDQISYSRSWDVILAFNPDWTRVATLVDNSIQI